MTGDLHEQYAAAHAYVRGQLTVLNEIMDQDYPDPAKGVLTPTRYQIDMLTALGRELWALTELHESG